MLKGKEDKGGHGEGGDSQRLGERELLDSNEWSPREMRQNEREKREEERGTALIHSPLKFNDLSSTCFVHL